METCPDPSPISPISHAAFSVSQSRTAQVRRYIARRQEHHARIRFEDELVSLLQRHGMEFDERYLLG